ncbi:tagatose kinase [Lichenicoccus sp.]|uniref:tagatose kinase n=1 Tax=Lichenicoccus sp. TaxID=2781899 RepID=UPI003D0F4F76
MIATLGEIVVEIIAETPGVGFRAPQALVGPFPSGAPAIFIDQVARLGQPAGIIGCVGDDDFGRLNIDRLRADGVDVSAIEIVADHPTGSAFVRYREDGTRDFVFNIRHSAAGRTRITEAGRIVLAASRHLHVMGSSLFSPALIAAAQQAVAQVKAAGGSISFDPNLRREMLSSPDMLDAMASLLRACDLFLPSGAELTVMTEAKDETAAIREILGLGVGAVVVKRGAGGASYHDPAQTLHMAAFDAEEIDPTGAGDCFGATFVTCRLQGRGIADSLRFANASGARAVSVRGPMQGASSFAELEAIIGRAA